MTDAHRRKKNPEFVRAQLIESAIALARDQGLNAVGVEAVSKASGVTRGGLFHHFANKQSLVDAVIQTLMSQFEDRLEAKMSLDPEPYGRFTRAYLDLALCDDESPSSMALWMSTITDPNLRHAWTDWVHQKLERCGADEQGVDLEAVRFAADGLWLGLLVRLHPSDRQALHERLISLTRAVSQKPLPGLP